MILALAYQVTGDRTAASQIADASWGMDENIDTTAVDDDHTLLHHAEAFLAEKAATLRLGEFSKDRAAIEHELYEGQLRFAAQGFLYHALGSETSRRDARALFLIYAKDVLRDHPQDPTLRNMLLGMYLHTLVDSYVHPEDPIAGHAPWHGTDMMPNMKSRYLHAALAARDVIEHGLPPVLPPPASTPDRNFPADDPFCARLVNTLSATYPQDARTGFYDFPDDALVNYALGPAAAHSWLRMARDRFYRRDYTRPTFTESSNHERLAIEYQGEHGRYAVVIPSFLHFLRTSSSEEAGRLRDEVVAHVRRALGSIGGEVIGKIEAQGALEVVDRICFNTFPGDYLLLDAPKPFRPRLEDSSAPGGRAASGQIEVMVTDLGRAPSGSGRSSGPLPSGDVARRIIVEVKERGWATDGLEKYLAPPSPQPGVTVVRVPGRDGPSPEREAALEKVRATARESRASVEIIAPPQTPDEEAVHRIVSQIAELAASQHAQAHPGGIRSLTVQGSGAASLPGILDRQSSQGLRLFEHAVAISPTVPPEAIPPTTPVIVHYDSRFHNFDPGSPGYEKMTQHARWFAKGHDVAVTSTSAAPAEAVQARSEMKYFARGATDPVVLTNVRISDVASSTAKRLLEVEQHHKPSTVGGVSLVTPAVLPIPGGAVIRAGYDGTAGCLILSGREGRRWYLPPMDAELARIAWEALYDRETSPELSIGVNPSSSVDPGRAGTQRVHYLGGIEDTIMGLVCLRADELLGELAFGGSEVLSRLGLQGSGLHTLPEMFPNAYAEGPRMGRGAADRVYLAPDRVVLSESSPGVLDFSELSFAVRFSPAGPAEEDFARTLKAQWARLRATPGGAPFRDLEQVVRVVSVFTWLKDSGVPFDESLGEVEVRRVFTPRDVLPRRTPRPESLTPSLPIALYDANGLSRMVDRQGHITRFEYENRQVRRVIRRDGAVLEVHRDALSEPVALSLTTTPWGAAFLKVPAEGKTQMLDRVQLRMKNGVFEGFDPTPQTRILYDISTDAVVSRVIDGFVSEVP
jgi:hypothetical protein